MLVIGGCPGEAYKITRVTELTPRLTAARERRCVAVQPQGGGRDQTRAGVDVVELDELDRGVHVADRDRHEARGHARAADMDRVGIGARARAHSPRP